jgi:hypothetical protein
MITMNVLRRPCVTPSNKKRRGNLTTLLLCDKALVYNSWKFQAPKQSTAPGVHRPLYSPELTLNDSFLMRKVLLESNTSNRSRTRRIVLTKRHLVSYRDVLRMLRWLRL